MERTILRLTIACLGVAAAAPPALAGQYRNLRLAVYVVVDDTKRLADPKILQTEFDRVMARVKFDKVNLEVYRDRHLADAGTLDGIKKLFNDREIIVEGGWTLPAVLFPEGPTSRSQCPASVSGARFPEVTGGSDGLTPTFGARGFNSARLLQTQPSGEHGLQSMAMPSAAVPRTEQVPMHESTQSHETGPVPQEFVTHKVTGNPLAIATHTLPASQLVAVIPL